MQKPDFYREGTARKYDVAADRSKETALAAPQFSCGEDGISKLRFETGKAHKR